MSAGDSPPPTVEEARRRGVAALAGHSDNGDEVARTHLSDPSPRVRATALAALARLDALTAADVFAALGDLDPLVRRRACALAIPFPEVDLTSLLIDPDASVVESAAFALGERAGSPAVVAGLCAVATGHADALCREAAVAALGALGDPAGLEAILVATTDKPAVRRRAVLAMAPFEGPEVDAVLERARVDRDWQVRQAAEDLLDG